MPSSTAIVYRVSYRRDGWKAGVWKNKLFNSEGAATKYAGNLLAPDTDKTPEKFRDLKPVTLRISFGMVRWMPLPDEDGVVEQAHADANDGWTTELRAVRDRMLSPSAGYTPEQCTLEKVMSFAASLEEE